MNRDPWTGRTLVTFGAIGVVMALAGDRFPTWAYGTLLLAALYLMLTNYQATTAAVEWLTNPES